jgi:hypothetical protein
MGKVNKIIIKELFLSKRIPFLQVIRFVIFFYSLLKLSDSLETKLLILAASEVLSSVFSELEVYLRVLLLIKF